MRRNFHLTFILAVLSTILYAQETKIVSLNDLLESTERENLTIKISEGAFEAAKGEFTQSGAVLFPKISISHSGMSTNNPLMAFGTKLNQEIVTQADFNPSLLNDPQTIDNFTTKIEVVQPIFNADGFHMRKAAKAKMGALELQSMRTKDAIKLEMTKAYMELQISYKVVDVLEKSVEAAKTANKIASDYFEQGYLQKSDLLSVEVFRTEIENSLQSAKANIKNASDYIHFLSGTPGKTLLKPADDLIMSAFSNESSLNTIEDRDDIAAMKKSMEAHYHMYKAANKGYLPRFNAFGSYELHDSKVFSGTAKGYLVGAQLSWNLFEGFNRIGKIKKTKADYNNAKLSLEHYENESQLTIEKTIRQLETAENSVQLTNLAVEQSKEALRIRTNRFEEGLEKTSDLLMAESSFLNKQLEAYQAIYNYNFTKAYLAFLTK